MTTVVGHLLGWGTLLVGAAAVTAVLVRRAAAFGLLAPILCGGALRLIVALLAHGGSVKLGDHGLMFLDDQGYLQRGGLLANLWAGGHTPDPAGYDVVGSYQFGYQAFLGGLFLLGAPSVVIGKLANVLLGTATVLLTARLSARLLGEATAARAAWLAALAPTMIWWSAPLMKEALATFLLTGALLAAAWLPEPRAIRWLFAALVALVMVRTPAALALVLTTLLLVAVGARKAESRWLSRSLLASGTLALVGGLFAAALVSGGRIQGFVTAYAFTIDRMVDQYQGSNPARIPLDFVKTMVSPLPWVFDTGTQNWDRGLYPGVWLLYCAYPLALMGAWRLRRQAAAVILLAPVVSTVLVNAVTAGFTFRQRSMIEPLVLLLAVAGARSARHAARAASVGLAVAAVAASVQSRSPLLGLLILCAAAIPLTVSRHFSSAPASIAADDGPLIAGFGTLTPAQRRPGFAGIVQDSVAGLAAIASLGRQFVERAASGAPRVEVPQVTAATTPRSAVAPSPSVFAAGRAQVRALRGAAPKPILPSVVGLMVEWVRVAALRGAAPQPAVASGRGLGHPRDVPGGAAGLARAILLWSPKAVAATRVQLGALRTMAPQPALASDGGDLTATLPAIARAMLLWSQRAVAGTQVHVGLIRRRARAPRAPALAASLRMPPRDLRAAAPLPTPALALPSGAALLGAWSSLRRLCETAGVGAGDVPSETGRGIALRWRDLLTRGRTLLVVLRRAIPGPRPARVVSPAVRRGSLRLQAQAPRPAPPVHGATVAVIRERWAALALPPAALAQSPWHALDLPRMRHVTREALAATLGGGLPHIARRRLELGRALWLRLHLKWEAVRRAAPPPQSTRLAAAGRLEAADRWAPAAVVLGRTAVEVGRALVARAVLEITVLRSAAPSAPGWVVNLRMLAVLTRASAPPVVAAAVAPVAIRILRLHSVFPEAIPAPPRTRLVDGPLTVELRKLRRAAPTVREPRRR